MQINALVECPLHDSFRVRQVAGMFDVPLPEKCRERFSVELPDLNESWRIGMIVGPSGSGKSTVARHAYGDDYFAGFDWPAEQAVIDCFGERPTKQITQALTAVGFSSPPSWIKPYHVLSGGEQFRCDLAQALLSDRSLVVFDEFTSVVDRTVAKIGSAAIAKAIRRDQGSGFRVQPAAPQRGNPEPQPLNPSNLVPPQHQLPRFIAVSCHYDVTEWLEPDWVLDMATGTLHRRRLRRPAIELEIFRCGYQAWRLFAKHHYLSAALNRASRCYLATWNDEPVAFCSLLNSVGRKGIWRISRIVVLPDYQGIGIGSRFCAAIGEMNRRHGLRTTITTSHPAMIGHLRHSKSWKIRAVAKGGNHWGGYAKKKNIQSTSLGRTVVSAEFFGVR